MTNLQRHAMALMRKGVQNVRGFHSQFLAARTSCRACISAADRIGVRVGLLAALCDGVVGPVFRRQSAASFPHPCMPWRTLHPRATYKARIPGIRM